MPLLGTLSDGRSFQISPEYDHAERTHRVRFPSSGRSCVSPQPLISDQVTRDGEIIVSL